MFPDSADDPFDEADDQPTNRTESKISVEHRGGEFLCGLTFELRRDRMQTPTGRGRTIPNVTWSGQAVAAVGRRRLERGVRLHCVTRPCV